MDPVGLPPSHDVASEEEESLLVIVSEVTNASNDNASLLPLLPHSFSNRSSSEFVFLPKSNDTFHFPDDHGDGVFCDDVVVVIICVSSDEDIASRAVAMDEVDCAPKYTLACCRRLFFLITIA
jgi:hypothetical protein